MENAASILARPETETSDWPGAGAGACPCLSVLFELQADKTPRADAVLGLDGQTVSYEELNRRANRLAHHLRARGAGPDALIGICAERSLEMIVAVLAAIKAGAAYVPLDPKYPRDRLRFMIDDSRAPILLTQERLLPLTAEARTNVICLDRDAAQWAQGPDTNLPPAAQPDHLAYVIYTSGSTGQPKGVAMRQEPLINLLQWQLENWSFPEPARTLQFTSLNFDVSFQEIFSTLCSGGLLVLVAEEVRRDPGTLLRFLQAQRVQRLFLPFIALKRLAEAALSEKSLPEDLKEVITAGEQLRITPALVDFFSRLDGCTLENQYGPSETHVVTAYRMSGPARTWPPLPSIGKAIANVTVHLLDAQRQPVPPGEQGELYFGGRCVARGYLHRPELTEARFIPDPFSPSPDARLYRTGDLAHTLPDGNIIFEGRGDHQVKINGVRVELTEIEAALAQHPDVKDAVVVARETANGEKQLVACVVPGPARRLPPREAREFLQRTIPAAVMPSAFILLDTLPLTPNGKVDRLALAKLNPQAQLEDDSSVAVAQPQTPLQLQLQLVFERFFKQRPIGIDAGFFELGGDSLGAVALRVELEKTVGKALSPNLIYQAPTIEKLAAAIERDGGAEWSSLVALQPLGTRPPLFLIHTTPGDVLGYSSLIYHLGLDQPCYGLQSLAFHEPERAHTTIEEMAAYYIKHIRALRPEGPYHLAGWCYGGVVAAEMARQLKAAGQKIAFLGLIETPAAAPAHGGTLARKLFCLARMKPSEWRTYLREKIKYHRGGKSRNELRFHRLEQRDGHDPKFIEEHNRYLDRLELVYGTNMQAYDKYRVQPYAGPIILFNAVEPDPAVIRDPLYGWKKLAQSIEIRMIPGNHDTILQGPQARLLAEALRRDLERSDSLTP
ncbi:MAG TPA: amino acid adenylation domain-containing protein [Verrucomicrobiae bacterium]|jgi:amino acid adenylation domain-containing protein|nr:amino acid adenylation domain-containing protein [Verrucomicrobiae bacterium]